MESLLGEASAVDYVDWSKGNDTVCHATCGLIREAVLMILFYTGPHPLGQCH